MPKINTRVPPKSSPSPLRAGLLIGLFGLVFSNLACAKLGGDLASVQSDTQAFAATTRQSALTGAIVHTQTLPNALVIRQYVDATGVVFAVGWEGPVLPDFQRLLGAHYSSYVDAARQQMRGVSVQGPALVIESGGMMRAFSGRAYLPALLPRSLTVQDIR
jgi:hypothetical protein